MKVSPRLHAGEGMQAVVRRYSSVAEGCWHRLLVVDVRGELGCALGAIPVRSRTEVGDGAEGLSPTVIVSIAVWPNDAFSINVDHDAIEVSIPPFGFDVGQPALILSVPVPEELETVDAQSVIRVAVLTASSGELLGAVAICAANSPMPVLVAHGLVLC